MRNFCIPNRGGESRAPLDVFGEHPFGGQDRRKKEIRAANAGEGFPHSVRVREIPRDDFRTTIPQRSELLGAPRKDPHLLATREKCVRHHRTRVPSRSGHEVHAAFSSARDVRT